MPSIIARALAILRQGRPFVEATVIRRQGSAPRAAGTKMIIDSDGKEEGTVGGGILEARVIETAQSALQSQRSQIIAFDLTGADVADTMMICGGRTEVLIDFIEPDPATIALFESRIQALENKTPGYYLTVIRGSEDQIHHADHHLLTLKDQAFAAIPSLSTEIMNKIKQRLRNSEAIGIIAGDDYFVVAEKLEIPKTAYFFGAGHVVKYTAAFAAQVGFRLVVIDDREEFANPRRYPQAEKTIVIKDFKNIFSRLTVDINDFLIIATRGHMHDRTVLAQALKSDAAYISMIGSASKRQTVYKSLLAEGYTQKDLDRVFCPIGLAIAAETPEEIGISIVAQMIQTRAGHTS
jgi:xanthine dehydrogenase accessory factor